MVEFVFELFVSVFVGIGELLLKLIFWKDDHPKKKDDKQRQSEVSTIAADDKKDK